MLQRGDEIPPDVVRLEFTKHALHVMEERAIPPDLVELAVAEPSLRTPDPNDHEVERFYRRSAEHDDRVLRVAVNTRVAPWRVVSVFFDRTMRGKL